jgi:hypothetical protein
MSYPNDPRRVPEADGMSAGAMAGIAVAVLLFLGIIIWAFNSGERETASNAPPATTGQRAPAPAPTPAPAPPPKAE